MRKKLFIFLVAVMSMIPMTAMAAPKTMSDGGRFDAKYYAATYPEIAQAIGTDENQLYLHYQVFGKPAGLMPFDIMAAVNTPGSVEAKKLANVTEAQMVAALKATPGIGAVEACTEETDKNGNMNKQGGYIASIYFEINEIDQSDFSGKIGPIAKATECGGNIEIYNNATWMKQRNTYLSRFDGMAISPGCHNVFGNSIYRISNRLSATKQNAYLLQIIKSVVTQ